MNQANNDLGQSMRVRFSPNYFDSPRVQETSERYAFWLAKLRGLRSRGWEVKVGASMFICVHPYNMYSALNVLYINSPWSVTLFRLNGFSSSLSERGTRT